MVHHLVHGIMKNYAPCPHAPGCGMEALDQVVFSLFLAVGWMQKQLVGRTGWSPKAYQLDQEQLLGQVCLDKKQQHGFVELAQTLEWWRPLGYESVPKAGHMLSTDAPILALAVQAIHNCVHLQATRNSAQLPKAMCAMMMLSTMLAHDVHSKRH